MLRNSLFIFVMIYVDKKYKFNIKIIHKVNKNIIKRLIKDCKKIIIIIYINCKNIYFLLKKTLKCDIIYMNK